MSDSLSSSSESLSSSSESLAAPRRYTVIARRYRPQLFGDLIGQEHVAKALTNAITTERVGHAYLFTGARGVGKTSAARILAKALNCERGGPTPNPCNACDVCRSIGSGDDVDVLEIDGASNRGIDEIRQLRQNANVRPSRARFKVYIIDEVHMLTREAFNALLKTLEEPPGHVKFIFCTTEPTKIPVTILSRCQRFDFAGIRRESIAQILARIVGSEGVAADAEALDAIARRAGGSMRDAQSLLEQLLAFAPERITLRDVHGMLGSAGEERLARLVRLLGDRDAGAALAELDVAVREGVDLAQLLEQLFGYLRDCMAAAVGCPPDAFLYASTGSSEAVSAAAKGLGLQTILAAMQILEQTLTRLRFSTQVRVLAELALVRIASLDDLDDLRSLIEQLQGAAATEARGPAVSSSRPQPAAPRQVKPPPQPEVVRSPPETDPPDNRPAATIALTAENAGELWSQALARLSGLGAQHAKDYSRVAISAPNRLVVGFKPAYTLAKSICERPDQVAKFQQALAEVTGAPVVVEFVVLEDEPDPTRQESTAPRVSPQQRLLEMSQHPMIRRAGELFGAVPLRVDDPPGQS
jgi:DNA polymerase-3 subunit gamma/tau